MTLGTRVDPFALADQAIARVLVAELAAVELTEALIAAARAADDDERADLELAAMQIGEFLHVCPVRPWGGEV